MTTGNFIPILIPFKDSSGNYISADGQATQILNEADKLIAAGAAGVAIIYSANYQQTQNAEAAYSAGKDTFPIGGNHQATVMSAMENLMTSTYPPLLGKMQIACITTLNEYASPWAVSEYPKWSTILHSDFQNLHNLLNKGWDILGWQNQKTIKTKSKYAIGNGDYKVPKKFNKYIQSHLVMLAKSYGVGKS